MQERQTERYVRAFEETPSQAYFMAALASIGLSGLLFLFGRRSLAFFVGMWPPTILALALFYKLLRPSGEPVTPEDVKQTVRRFTD